MGKYSKQHWTWWRGEQKAKMGFDTLDDALHWKKINTRKEDDLQPYFCPEEGCINLRKDFLKVR